MDEIVVGTDEETGKSLVLGWDSRWVAPMKVTADGSPTTGTVRPFGLDCSGFVGWVLYNTYDGEYIIGHGGGASDHCLEQHPARRSCIIKTLNCSSSWGQIP